MNTIARVMELADERNLSLFKLSQLCDVSYSTLKNAEMRGSQLGVPTRGRSSVPGLSLPFELFTILLFLCCENSSAYTGDSCCANCDGKRRRNSNFVLRGKAVRRSGYYGYRATL